MAKSILGISPDVKENEIRYRVRDPHLFQGDTFVTVNIGDYHRLIRAIPKHGYDYLTQSVRMDKSVENNPEEIKVTRNLIEQAKRER